MRSGVNWMRPKEREVVWEIELTSRVFCQSGYPHEESMSLGEHAKEHSFDCLLLPDDDL